MAKKKVREEELAEVLLDDLDKFENFAVTYGKHILIAAAVIIIGVLIGGIGYFAYQNNRLTVISEIADAKTIPQLERVTKKYPNYKETNEARLKLAILYVEKKEYKKALEQLEQIERAPDVSKIVRWQAMMNMGYVKEMNGDKPGAIEKFETLGASLEVPAVLRAEANYNAGRILGDLNKKDRAVKLLELAIKDYSEKKDGASFDPFWKYQAKVLLARIKTINNVTQTSGSRNFKKKIKKSLPEIKNQKVQTKS